MKVFLFLHAVAAFVVAGCAEERPKLVRSQPPVNTMDNETPGSKEPSGESSALDPEIGVAPGAPLPTTGAGAAAPTGATTEGKQAVQGLMTFDLSSANQALAGATFSAQVTLNPAAGSIPASITFRNMIVQSGNLTGMSIVGPVLVIQDGSQEKVLPFGGNVNMRIPKGRSVPLGGVPTANFEGVSAAAQLKIRFSALDSSSDSVASGIPTYRECKAPQTFQAVSVALKPCQSCHAGLFSYDFMERDLATSCGLNLQIIDPALNQSGRIPVIPTGNHKGLDMTMFRNSLATWRSSE